MAAAQYFDPPPVCKRMRKILLIITRTGNVSVTGPGWMGPNTPRDSIFFLLTTSSSEQLLTH